MSELKFNIDADAINKYLSDSIIKSAIGEGVAKKIEKEIQDACYGYNSPVGALIREAIKLKISEIIALPENQEKLKVSVAKFLTQEAIDKVVETGVEELKRMYKDRYS